MQTYHIRLRMATGEVLYLCCLNPLLWLPDMSKAVSFHTFRIASDIAETSAKVPIEGCRVDVINAIDVAKDPV